MEFMPQLATLASVMLLACISPGPDFIAVTSQSLSDRKAGIGAAIGVTVACLIWATLAIFGLGMILSRLSWLYEVIRYLGAAYLIYLGIRMLIGLRLSATELAISAAPVRTMPRALRRGFLVGMTNPKSAAFFGSLFVTVLPIHAPLWVHGVTLAIVGIVACGWFCTLALLFSMRRIRNIYLKLRRPFDAVMGGLLVAIGARLAIDN